jgi:hypothetical protein
MHIEPNFTLQPLESRRLLHAGPHLGAGDVVSGIGVLAECPEVVEARAALQEAVQQLLTDQRAGRKTLKADRAAIVEEMKQLADEVGQEAIKHALQPLKDQLRADERAKFKELRAANEELRVAKRQGRQLLAADLEALHEAQQSGDHAAIDAAREKLQATKAQVQEDLKPIRDNILAIKDKWRPIITADHEAVESKLEELNPDLVPLFDKLEADTEALQEKLESGHATVSAATGELKVAIQDCLEAHGEEHVA